MRGPAFSSSASAFFFDLKRLSFFALALPIDDVPNDGMRWWVLSIRTGKGGPVSLKKSRKARVSSRVILVTASRLWSTGVDECLGIIGRATVAMVGRECALGVEENEDKCLGVCSISLNE